MKDEVFEKWWLSGADGWNSQHDPVGTINAQRAEAGWQAAGAHLREEIDNWKTTCQSVQMELDRLREPQTAETCQAVPPHPRACLVEFRAASPEMGGLPEINRKCLVCEVTKEARDAALLEAKKTTDKWCGEFMDVETSSLSGRQSAFKIRAAIHRLREET